MSSHSLPDNRVSDEKSAESPMGGYLCRLLSFFPWLPLKFFPYHWLLTVHQRDHMPCCMVPCGCRCHCSWKARVMCAASTAITAFSGAVDSVTMARGWSCRYHLHCSPGSTSSMCSVQSPSDVKMCGSLQHPVLLGKGNFVELFY